MVKKKAILHIGGHKTGTSAIQAFCVSNASRLQHLGILYPLELLTHRDIVGDQAHHGLVNLFMDATTFWKSHNLRPGVMTDADIVSYLKSLPRDKNILLSSENLVWLDTEAINALKHILDGYDVHIVLYARRQDNALQALYQTVVATIGEAKQFNDYASEGVRVLFEYDRIAENWQSVFGVGSVVIRVYEPDQLYNRDAVMDFIRVIADIMQMQLEISDWDRSSGIVNRGFPVHIIALLRYFNSAGGKKWTLPAIKILAEVLYKEARGTYEIISPSQRRELLDSFAKSNENLARKFLGREDGILFHDLSIKQTDKEWNDKYNQLGSYIRLLLRDIIFQVKTKN